jgi:hypothetical protein
MTFRFYVYGGTFDNPPGYLLSARGTVFGALCVDGSFGYVGTTVCFLPLFLTLWFGMEDYRLVVCREVGCDNLYIIYILSNLINIEVKSYFTSI